MCVHRLLLPSLWISVIGLIHCLSQNQELGGYVCPFPMQLLWVAQGSSGFRHPLNYLQVYLSKHLVLNGEIFVLLITIGAHLEGSEESLGCVHFCYSRCLFGDVTPSQMMWHHC